MHSLAPVFAIVCSSPTEEEKAWDTEAAILFAWADRKIREWEERERKLNEQKRKIRRR